LARKRVKVQRFKIQGFRGSGFRGSKGSEVQGSAPPLDAEVYPLLEGGPLIEK
jgi:hypothetical protein